MIKLIKRLSKCVREYKLTSILSAAFVGLEVIMEVLIPLEMSKMIDFGINAGDMAYVTKSGVKLIVFALLAILFGNLAGRCCAIASSGFAKNLRHDMYYNIQNFSFSNIDKFSASSLVTRMTTDVSNVQNAYQMLIRMAFRSPMMMIFSAVFAFRIYPRLAMIFVACLPVLMAGLYFIMTKTHPIFKRVFKTYDLLNQKVQENLRGIRVVKSFIREGFENRWIDVYENEGKRSGAYSAGARVHPYVLLNFKGTLDDVFTLVHEMGHSIHSYLSNTRQPTAYQDYVIFVAEVASTCNEALLMEYLLGKTTDKKERAYLINHFLDQFKGTLYRQTMFAEFELNIGKMAAEGQTLTADVLCAEYKRLNELYYGPDMVVDDNIAMEWARIPHFYYNYYVFQYATGYAAAIALSEGILKGLRKNTGSFFRWL